jgi:hypothetical protein
METQAEKAAQMARLAAARERLGQALVGLATAERARHGTISGVRGTDSRKSDADNATPMLSAAAKSVT